MIPAKSRLITDEEIDELFHRLVEIFGYKQFYGKTVEGMSLLELELQIWQIDLPRYRISYQQASEILETIAGKSTNLPYKQLKTLFFDCANRLAGTRQNQEPTGQREYRICAYCSDNGTAPAWSPKSPRTTCAVYCRCRKGEELAGKHLNQHGKWLMANATADESAHRAIVAFHAEHLVRANNFSMRYGVNESMRPADFWNKVKRELGPLSFKSPEVIQKRPKTDLNLIPTPRPVNLPSDQQECLKNDFRSVSDDEASALAIYNEQIPGEAAWGDDENGTLIF